MKRLIVRLYLTGAWLAALAAPALADGSPIPWPKKSGQLTLVVVASPRLIADGSPIPWPKKVTEPGVVSEPDPTSTTVSPRLVADGSPIPWPKKSSALME